MRARVKALLPVAAAGVLGVVAAVLALAGYVMDQAMIRLRRRLCPWYTE